MKLKIFDPSNPPAPREIFLKMTQFEDSSILVELVDREGATISAGVVGRFELQDNKLVFNRFRGVNSNFVKIDPPNNALYGFIRVID